MSDEVNFVLIVLSLGASFLPFADILPVSVMTAQRDVERRWVRETSERYASQRTGLFSFMRAGRSIA